MMISDIRPIHHPSYTCIEDIIACVAEYLNCEPILMFSEVWNFRYTSLEEEHIPFGEKIFTNKGNYGTYTHFHGLSIEDTGEIEYSRLLILIKEKLLNCHPIAIYIDSYWCPWNEAYLTHHFPHYCLIIGIDEAKGVVYCLDPYLTKEIKELPFDHIQQGTHHGYIFGATSPKIEGIDHYLLVYKAAQRIIDQTCDGNNALDSIRKFADDIGKSLNLPYELQKYESARVVPLFKLLSYVGWARVNFSTLLSYFAKENEDHPFKEWANQFTVIGNRWLVIQKMLVKECIHPSPRFSRFAISDKLFEIADLEENTAYSIIRRSL